MRVFFLNKCHSYTNYIQKLFLKAKELSFTTKIDNFHSKITLKNIASDLKHKKIA